MSIVFCNRSDVTGVTTRWAKEHDLTDMVLTVLEDDVVMCVAFVWTRVLRLRTRAVQKPSSITCTMGSYPS
jgi:hypothetical protein